MKEGTRVFTLFDTRGGGKEFMGVFSIFEKAYTFAQKETGDKEPNVLIEEVTVNPSAKSPLLKQLGQALNPNTTWKH